MVVSSFLDSSAGIPSHACETAVAPSPQVQVICVCAHKSNMIVAHHRPQTPIKSGACTGT